MKFLSLLLCSNILLISSGHTYMHKLVRARRDIRIENEYFILTKDGIDPSDYVTELTAMQKRGSIPDFKIELQGITHEVAPGFSAKLSETALREVLKSDKVEYVYEDHKLVGGSASTTPTTPTNTTTATSTSRIVLSWGLDRLDQEDNKYNAVYNPPCGLTGKGVDVYVLDSGIWYTHQEFQGRALSPGCDPIDQIFATNKSGLDCTGHGTHVAGTIGGKKYGVASGVTLFSVRVLNCDNTGTSNSVILGAECVMKNAKKRKRPSIVNMSIYGNKSLIVKRALDTLMRKGITVVSIAGNSDKPRDSCKVAPGSIQGVITASASTRTDRPYMRSNAGKCVDLYAPGTSIQSASIYCDVCRSSRQGSSMAAPHVTGAIALLLEKCPTISPWRVRHLLLSQMVLANKLNFSKMPKIFRAITPNLLLHTSSLKCDLQC